MNNEYLEIRCRDQMKNSSFLHPSFLLLKSFCFRISSILLEVHQKYSAARRIFNSLLSVSSGDETLRLITTS